MKNLLFFFLFMAGIIAPTIAQNDGLRIEYNLYTDQVVYSRNGVILEKPVAKSQEKISVIITEFNPHVYNAKVEVSKINYSQSSSHSEGLNLNASGVGSSGVGSLFGNLNMGSDLGLSSLGLSGNQGTFGFARKKLSANHQAAYDQYVSLNSRFVEAEEKLNMAYKKLQLFQMAEKSRDMALADIGRLKTNPNIRPSRIKELIEEEIRYAFAKNEGETIDIDDLINEMAKEAELAKSLDKYAMAKKDYAQINNEWTSYSNYLQAINYTAEDKEIIKVKSATEATIELMNTNLEKMKKDSLERRFAAYNSDLNAIKMSLLRQEYEEVKGNIFTYSFPPILAEGDEINLRISILYKEDNYKVYKTIDQKVNIEGAWRIAGGVGLTFGGLSDPIYKYSIINNTIIQDKLDDFVPFMTSFAHIYMQRQRGINVAGSFGVGMPLSARESVRGLTFFIGPSLIIGRKQRMLITTGIMGARVSRLSSGLQTGDTFNSVTNTLPYSEKYELGYFIGISYDIL